MTRLFHLGRFRPDPERDLDSELDFHFRETFEELERQGLSPDDARAETERRFGNLRGHRAGLEQVDRDMVRMNRRQQFFSASGQNLTHALRSLRHAPGFSLTVIGILTLGIWANAVMFGILDRILFQPPAHIEEHQQLRRVFRTRPVSNGAPDLSISLSYPDYEAMKTVTSFAGVAAYSSIEDVTLGRGREADRARMSTTTPGFAPLLGVEPIRGRFFAAADDEPGVPLTAVISYGFWRRHFGGAPDVLGRTIDLGFGGFFGGGATVTVIGIMPQGFTGLDLERIDLWLPLTATQDLRVGIPRWRDTAGFSFLRIVTRLKPGVTDDSARTEADHLYRNLHRDVSRPDDINARSELLLGSVIAARGPDSTRESIVAHWLGGVSLIVLLIACINVVNLTLGRAVDRRREIAVRLALGISRRRLITQVTTENIILAMVSGGIALFITGLSAGLLQGALFPGLSWPSSPIGGRIIAFTAIISILSGCAAGLIPAVQASRPSLALSMHRDDGRSSGRRSRMGMILQIAQGTLSVLLLIGAGLFLRSLSRVNAVDLGLDRNHLVEVMLEMDDISPEAATIRERYDDAAHRVSRIPEVDGVTITTSPVGWGLGFDISVPGLDSLPETAYGPPMVHFVSPGHARVLGLRLISGRYLAEGDGPHGNRVMIVDALMARKIWPDRDAVGQQVIVNSQGDDSETGIPHTVVGVVENMSNGELIEAPAMMFYLPLEEAPDSHTARALYVRTTGDPVPALSAIQRAAVGNEPGLRYAGIRTVREIFDPEARAWSLGATMFSAFGFLALAVASAGLYSLLAFDIARRTRELGIRTALGADQGMLIRLVIREGLRLTLIGLGLGFTIALVAARFVQPLLFEVSATDPVVYGTITATLILTALAAAAVPAWRVSRLDPVTALRVE